MFVQGITALESLAASGTDRWLIDLSSVALLLDPDGGKHCRDRQLQGPSGVALNDGLHAS